MLWIKNIAIVLLLLVASFANAEQALTSQQIQQWLKSADSIQQWADKHEDLLEEDENEEVNIDESFSAEFLIAQVKEAGLYDEAKNIVQDNGYDSLEEWTNIQIKIMKTMMALEMEKEKGKTDEMMAQLEAFKNNPSIPAEQKEMMTNMMQSGLQMMEKLSNVPDADKAALKPFLSQVKQKLDWDDEDDDWDE